MADQNQPTPTPVKTEEATPAPVSDKTEDMKANTAVQFDKLLKSNQELYEEKRKMIEENERLKRDLKDKDQPESEDDKAYESISDLIDTNEKTGEKFLNPVKLAQKIDALTKKAEEPSKKVEELKETIFNKEAENQKVEAFTAYPQLDNNSKEFDAGFMRRVRSVMSDSVRFSGDYGGRTLSLKEAADWVKKESTPVEEKKDPKEEVTAEPTKEANPQRVPNDNPDDFARAVDATRRNNVDALAYRLESIKDTYTEKVQ